MPILGQTATGTEPGLPREPREIFAAATSLYNFSDAALKPWRLKATYQLYDEKGEPSEQGTYEYWWVSPHVYRSTWTRPGATHTDWHTADGKHAYLVTGGPLRFFEYKLQGALLSPLPDSLDVDPAMARMERQTVSFGSIKLPCIMVIPLMPEHELLQTVPLGLFSTYCFDPQKPILRVNYSFGTVAMEFNKIVKVQNSYLPREILLFEGKRKILSAEVDTITGLAPSDPALTPAPEATVVGMEKVQISAGIAVGNLIKKQIPIYPQDAKIAHVSGTVVLKATIGVDGGIHDLRIVLAPWPSLAASALWAVSHWEYRPYLLNGKPVDVETTINVIFALER
ncbi:MAG: energy transducer TonB [Terracidiphilus sp.]